MSKADKGLKDFARRLVGLSLDQNRVVTSERVEGVLQALAARPRRNLKTILKLYLLYIRYELRKSEAVVEHAGVISGDSLRRIEEMLTKRYDRAITATARENRDLIAGMRISVGDDVYDATVLGQLEAFSRNIG